MVLDFGVSQIPMPVFMAVHVTAFLVAMYLASRASALASPPALRSAFILFGVAELLYMGYHLAITTFLLSHTVAEALDLAAFVLAFWGFAQQSRRRSQAPPLEA